MQMQEKRRSNVRGRLVLRPRSSFTFVAVGVQLPPIPWIASAAYEQLYSQHSGFPLKRRCISHLIVLATLSTRDNVG